MKSMLCVVSCVVAACGATNHVSPDTMQTATAPLICQDETQCGAWWQRAQQWVERHGAYPLRTVTASLIATAGPEGGSGKLAYEITKSPNGDGSATIGFSAHCDSMLGCHPNPWEAGAAFKRCVRTAVACNNP
jgi:hypothetical protein